MAQPMQVLRHNQVSAEGAQIAATYALGIPQAEFGVRGTKKTVMSTIACGIAALMFGVIFFGLASSARDTSIALFIGLPFTVFFLACALYCGFYTQIYRSHHVYLCSEGFAHQHGQTIDAFRYDGIEAIWQAVTRSYYNGVYTGTRHKYTIRRKDGAQTVLNDKFADVEEIYTVIKQKVTAILLPQMMGAFQAGYKIPFGPLNVSLHGLDKGRELLPWQQIKAIKVEQGNLIIQEQGKIISWLLTPVSRVANLDILLHLLNSPRQR